jgi:hypothetical protein
MVLPQAKLMRRAALTGAASKRTQRQLRPLTVTDLLSGIDPLAATDLDLAVARSTLRLTKLDGMSQDTI